MLLSLRAMSVHVVVVRGTGSLHLVDSLSDVLVDFIEIVPVMNSFGQRAAGNEGETESDDYSGFLHGASLGCDFTLIHAFLSSAALPRVARAH